MTQAEIIRCECGVSVRVPAQRGQRTLRCPKCRVELAVPPAAPAAPAAQVEARQLSTGSDGVLCPICQTRITAGEERVACPECEQSHHQDCWVEIGGCSTYGCTRAPSLETDGPAQPPHTAWGDNKQCPACGETIKSIALRCRYCGTDFESVDPLQLRDLHRRAVRDDSLKKVRQSAVALFVVSLVGCFAPLMLIISLCVVIPKHKQLVKSGPLYAVMGWAAVVISGFWSLILLGFAVAN